MTHNWIPNDGGTLVTGPGRGKTTVYVNGYNSFINSFMTLAHEFAHLNGVGPEEPAEQAAVDAYNAWKADGGAQCPLNNGGNNSVDPALNEAG